MSPKITFFGSQLPKFGGFENASLKIDGFGRTPRTRTNAAPATLCILTLTEWIRFKTVDSIFTTPDVPNIHKFAQKVSLGLSKLIEQTYDEYLVEWHKNRSSCIKLNFAKKVTISYFMVPHDKTLLTVLMYCCEGCVSIFSCGRIFPWHSLNLTPTYSDSPHFGKRPNYQKSIF